MHKIDILMATYNSEKYISEQLSSILNQTYKNYHLYIQDDNSQDNTLDILSKYKLQHNNLISFNQNNEQCGIIKNFSLMLEKSTADYIMFSDHDDVWFQNKVEITYNKMMFLEKKYSSDIPLLIFTDKTVTDSHLNILNVSHNKSEELNAKNINLNRLLMGNVVSGCTIMINKALKDICRNIFEIPLMYDYQLAIIATTFGYIGFIDEPTMFYRQHKHNYVGAKYYSLKNIIRELKTGRPNIRQKVLTHISQIECFYNQYENILNEENKKIFQNFISLKDKKHLSFITTVIKNGFYKPSIIRNLGLIYAFL